MADRDFLPRGGFLALSPIRAPPFRPKRPAETTKGGYSLDRFPHPPRRDFICSTCGGVVRDPKECVGCGALCCSRCWDAAAAPRPSGYYLMHPGRDTTCPACRGVNRAREPSRILKRLILGLMVRCKNHKAGCDELAPLCDIKSHQRTCKFRQIKCSNSLCCASEGCIEDFIKVSIAKPNSAAFTVFVCSEVCRKTLLIDRLICDNEVEKAVEEFHMLAKVAEEKAN